jgi:hypothetical protein
MKSPCRPQKGILVIWPKAQGYFSNLAKSPMAFW